MHRYQNSAGSVGYPCEEKVIVGPYLSLSFFYIFINALKIILRPSSPILYETPS